MSFWKRSYDELRKYTAKAIRSNPSARDPELTFINFKTPEALNSVITGCDEDIGGFSSVNLDFEPSENAAVFHGNLSLQVPVNPSVTRSGYAAFRTKVPAKTIFGTPRFETDGYQHIALRVKGDRRKYFVNVQGDTFSQTDLWQHRLFLSTPGQWETVMIPFGDFVLTSEGKVERRQDGMPRDKVRTVGISILDRQEGPYKLHIQWIKAMGDEASGKKPEHANPLEGVKMEKPEAEVKGGKRGKDQL
ncbi:CIA30-domain-containing protein [Saitoella complicata NRRL Y-17804]|uniref:NADH:ubiquinone oxidoreductase intermediate-associated protein 30 domain-containing protein n=1 Tax=Saitoella complicata (strain BCRC 22490 / CBS 7301 / JCM 7358 / NBRC 10748 / NRRL Y-17804) TaxID=698492 RepID=A0A0E9NGV6_SAICN|nr:CIA30-domain-containing protein [Saitoella complicata NRRL Y-17804]ODQ52989.1 CIA30-domain-containing protein [Saitoella complicata NRRL Y-17804]GAO49043.1 hypothetical protein G7K_3204-t1 [Saitoella complicata NRRL Y-17804]